MSPTFKNRLFICLLLSVIFFTGCPDQGSNNGTNLGEGDGENEFALSNNEGKAFDLVNDVRVNLGLDALITDASLLEVARAHSQDMVDRDFFDHVNPDGESPFDRMGNAGITYTTAGENIAWNQGFANPATTAVDGWIDSPGHYTNMINDRYTHTGMGVAGNDNVGYYFTQLFARFSKDATNVNVEVHYTTPISVIAK